MVAYCAYIIYNPLDTIFVGMGSIHPDNIHARLEKTTDKIDIASTVADTSYNFSLFHTIFPCFVLQRYKKMAKEWRKSSFFEKNSRIISVID
jgi:hypothetical protein